MCLLGCVDEFLDHKLYCLDNKRHPIGNANGIIIGEEVGCEF